MDIKSILNILNPQPKTGALEINDVDLKFAQIENNRLTSYSIKLAEGIVKEGKIIDRDGFLKALSDIRSQITNNKKKETYVVVNIPDNNIYLQTFSLPAISNDKLEEAAKLNLRMISPVDFEKAYADWQLIRKSTATGDNGQLEILGSFINAEIINEIDECLKQSGFVPIAVEFNALSLTRLAVELGNEISEKNPFILISIGNNGLSFNLIKNGHLHFNHFVSWQSAYAEERQIPLETFKKLIIDEFRKVLSFYNARWQEPIQEIILTTNGIEESVTKIISENFSFKIRLLSLKKFESSQAAWFPAIGSALRGAIPWSEDSDVSLAKIGTKEKFFQYKSLKFVEIWRNIIVTLSFVMVIIFIGADVFLRQTEKNLENQLSNAAQNPQEEKEEKELLKEIQTINKQIEMAAMAYEKRTILSPFLEKIKKLSGDNNISLTRIFVQSWTTPIFVNAFAPNSETALNFRNQLINDGNFENVDLPITKITPSGVGVNFIISFKIKK